MSRSSRRRSRGKPGRKSEGSLEEKQKENMTRVPDDTIQINSQSSTRKTLKSTYSRKLPLRVKEWLLYGVVLSILAVFLAIIFDLFAGYHFNQIKLDRFPDILLANFAVAVNVKSLIVDKKSIMSYDDQFNYSLIPVSTIVLTIALYSMFYRRVEKSISTFLTPLLLISLCILIVNVLLGAKIVKNYNGAEQENSKNSERGDQHHV